MKKVLSLILVLVVLCSFAACSNPEAGGPSEDTNAAKYAKVAAYVEENRQALLTSFESSFTNSANGLTCSTRITASKDGFVIDVSIDQLENVSDDIKSQMQSAYDALDPTFESALEAMQKDLPELGYFTVYVRDKNGDLLATVRAGD